MFAKLRAPFNVVLFPNIWNLDFLENSQSNSTLNSRIIQINTGHVCTYLNEFLIPLLTIQLNNFLGKRFMLILDGSYTYACSACVESVAVFKITVVKK